MRTPRAGSGGGQARGGGCVADGGGGGACIRPGAVERASGAKRKGRAGGTGDGRRGSVQVSRHARPPAGGNTLCARQSCPRARRGGGGPGLVEQRVRVPVPHHCSAGDAARRRRRLALGRCARAMGCARGGGRKAGGREGGACRRLPGRSIRARTWSTSAQMPLPDTNNLGLRRQEGFGRAISAVARGSTALLRGMICLCR